MKSPNPTSVSFRKGTVRIIKARPPNKLNLQINYLVSFAWWAFCSEATKLFFFVTGTLFFFKLGTLYLCVPFQERNPQHRTAYDRVPRLLLCLAEPLRNQRQSQFTKKKEETFKAIVVSFRGSLTLSFLRVPFLSETKGMHRGKEKKQRHKCFLYAKQ